MGIQTASRRESNPLIIFLYIEYNSIQIEVTLSLVDSDRVIYKKTKIIEVER